MPFQKAPWLILEVLQDTGDTGSPWHCVFGVPVFAMLLQSFPGASAVMEEPGDLHLDNQLRLSTLMIFKPFDKSAQINKDVSTSSNNAFTV